MLYLFDHSSWVSRFRYGCFMCFYLLIFNGHMLYLFDHSSWVSRFRYGCFMCFYLL